MNILKMNLNGPQYCQVKLKVRWEGLFMKGKLLYVRNLKISYYNSSYFCQLAVTNSTMWGRSDQIIMYFIMQSNLSFQNGKKTDASDHDRK